MGPHLAGALGVLIVDLTGTLHVSQPLQRQGGAEDVTQDALDVWLFVRKGQRVAHEDRETRPLNRPGLQDSRGIGGQALAGD